jgi:hypothetical protein
LTTMACDNKIQPASTTSKMMMTTMATMTTMKMIKAMMKTSE